jgi:hypothetical protein
MTLEQWKKGNLKSPWEWDAQKTRNKYLLFMKKYIHFCILCLLMVSCDFLVRPNLLQVLVNGENFNKIPVKKG